MATFRPVYTLSGASPLTRGFPIAASEAIDIGDVVALNTSGAIEEPTSDATEVLGICLEKITAGAATGVDTDTAIVQIFTEDVVYAVKQPAALSATVEQADVGDPAELDLSSNQWGITDAGTAGTASTPQFKIVDIDAERGEYHVVIDVAGIADTYQWYDGAQVS